MTLPVLRLYHTSTQLPTQCKTLFSFASTQTTKHRANEKDTALRNPSIGHPNYPRTQRQNWFHHSITFEMWQHMRVNELKRRAAEKFQVPFHEFSETASVNLIVPLLKPGKDPKNALSYRPIALASTLSKVMESIVLQRVRGILHSYGTIFEHQAGWQQRRGTFESLLSTMHSIRQIQQRRLLNETPPAWFSRRTNPVDPTTHGRHNVQD
mmetsp:Transcript_18704/g.33462  ORF Transcript_18704/g.33462 Transcript_18704/m.33462 type:complete len:210 (-) Transcript_18704:453-1082(-)